MNILVPMTFAKLVKVFETGSKTSPWPLLLSYVALRFLQSSGGINALRDVSQTIKWSEKTLTVMLS